MTLSDIKSIAQLKKNLNLGPGYGGYMDLLAAIKISKEEWEPFCTWKEKRYTRNCIASCDGYELLLMCWEAGQQSPIHNYNFQESWIKVLQGSLTIEIFEIDPHSKKVVLDEEIQLNEKEYLYLNDTMGFHRVKNDYPKETVSLHLNIEKVTQWTVFHSCKQEFEIVKPHYDSYSIECID